MRGKGYGRALLVDLARIARDRGCGRMEWAVLNWNEPAIEFYKKLDAAPLDEWKIFRLTGDGIKKLADSRHHIIPGHDPQVAELYPAAAPGLEEWVVRLDLDPKE